MDSFEMNKILGAILGTCLVLVAMNIAAGAVFSPRMPAKPGYDIVVKETKPSGPAGEQQPQPKPLGELLASADTNRGKEAAKKCEACHSFDKGGPNKVGPNLWAVVGRKRASEPGFDYSAAMKSAGGNWTLEELNKFLANPRGDIPGTKMTFAGLPRDSERADAMAFLNSLSDNPGPLKAADAGAAK
jgi:cytochrome c